MSEESDEEIVNDATSPEEPVAKARFKISKPDPIIYYIAGPFLIVFVIYIVLTKVFISSDLGHEAKLERVMVISNSETSELSEENIAEADDTVEPEISEGGFLDIHNYFQFPVAFAVNIPETNKNLTFELAVSSFQSGVTAEWFFESFTAFVPAMRSDILYFMATHSLDDLQSSDFQEELLENLKKVINEKLRNLGAEPEVSKVMFVSFIIT
jgi:flagellar basal body-associated protein FliL